MDILRSIQDFINNLSTDEWSVITEVIVATFVLPVIIQITRWVTRVKTENMKFLLAIGVTALSGMIAYIHGNPQFGAWFAFAQGAMNFFTSQPAYRFGMKQLFAKIKQVWQNELAKAYEAKTSEAQKSAMPIVEPASPDFL